MLEKGDGVVDDNHRYKVRYLREIVEQLTEQLDMAAKAARKAQAEANEHKGAMESRYDTFKEESQYLSAAQKLRSASLENAILETETLIKALTGRPPDTVELGALVATVDDDDVHRRFFIVPYGLAGIQPLADCPATVIGKDSPMALSLLGCSVGDEVEVALPKGLSNFYISAIE